MKSAMIDVTGADRTGVPCAGCGAPTAMICDGCRQASALPLVGGSSAPSRARRRLRRLVPAVPRGRRHLVRALLAGRRGGRPRRARVARPPPGRARRVAGEGSVTDERAARRRPCGRLCRVGAGSRLTPSRARDLPVGSRGHGRRPHRHLLRALAHPRGGGDAHLRDVVPRLRPGRGAPLPEAGRRRAARAGRERTPAAPVARRGTRAGRPPRARRERAHGRARRADDTRPPERTRGGHRHPQQGRGERRPGAARGRGRRHPAPRGSRDGAEPAHRRGQPGGGRHS